MASTKKILVGGVALAALAAAVASRSRVTMGGIAERVTAMLPRRRRLRGGPAAALRDAGWVRVLNADATVVRGRGQLIVWNEPETLESANPLRGRLDWFTPADELPVAGEVLMLFPETAGEQIAVSVRSTESMGGRTMLHLEWVGTDMPVSLRELGGH